MGLRLHDFPKLLAATAAMTMEPVSISDLRVDIHQREAIAEHAKDQDPRDSGWSQRLALLGHRLPQENRPQTRMDRLLDECELRR